MGRCGAVVTTPPDCLSVATWTLWQQEVSAPGGCHGRRHEPIKSRRPTRALVLSTRRPLIEASAWRVSRSQERTTPVSRVGAGGAAYCC